MNIKILIEYEGTNFSGWQKQPGLSTIQGEIENALQIISGKQIQVFASGRTDAGVHALAQVANFAFDTKIPAQRIKNALNHYLPDEIRVLVSEEVEEGFHARFTAKRKTYLYRIQTGGVKRPFERNISYYVRGDLDLDKMRTAAEFFVGEHDFSAFKSEGSSAQNFVRNIYSLTITKNHDVIEIEITGNGFLYNMVRIIAGTLIEIGKGKSYNISKILASKDREEAGPTAPARGLFLKRVEY